MNLENLFFWMSALSCAALLVRCVPLLRQGRALGGAIVGAAILTVGGAGMVFSPGHIGAVAGSLWFALIALPSLLIRAVLRYALGQRYLQAERVARLVRWLRGVVFIVALQVAFDLLTPRVSLAAHAAGALIGFVSTMLLMTVRASRQRIA